jgi:hypothetical protein
VDEEDEEAEEEEAEGATRTRVTVAVAESVLEEDEEEVGPEKLLICVRTATSLEEATWYLSPPLLRVLPPWVGRSFCWLLRRSWASSWVCELLGLGEEAGGGEGEKELEWVCVLLA